MTTETTDGPWERRDGEPAKGHAALVEYLRLGPDRTLADAAAAVKKCKSLISRWSWRWGWVERAAAYDRHVLRVEQGAIDRAAAELAAGRVREQARPVS